MIRVNVDVGDPAGLVTTFGAGALIRLERSALEAGPFAEISTLALDADVADYTLWDPAGVATSWYRWRVSDADETAHSAYSDPFQGIDTESVAADRYAPLSAVLGRYQQDVPDALRTRLDNALLDATGQIIDLLGFDFFAHEVEDYELDDVVTTRRGLCVHDGIVSAESIGTRSTVSEAWVVADTAGWAFERPQKPGHPSFHIRLTGSIIALHRWPSHVRFSGVRGWPAIPRSASVAAVDRARQMVAWDPSRPGGVTGPEELGNAIGPNRMPDTMYRLRHDFGAWELGLAQCEL